MAVKVIDMIQEFGRENSKALDLAVGRMAQDIKILAFAKAPYKTGKLTSSGKTVRVAISHHEVRFEEDYAAYQERGARKDGSHVVRHYTTANTGKDFLKGAGKVVGSKGINYLRQAAGQIKV